MNEVVRQRLPGLPNNVIGYLAPVHHLSYLELLKRLDAHCMLLSELLFLSEHIYGLCCKFGDLGVRVRAEAIRVGLTVSQVELIALAQQYHNGVINGRLYLIGNIVSTRPDKEELFLKIPAEQRLSCL